MAKPNFSFQKRQREMEKKRKKEEKLQRKLDKRNPPSEDGEPEPGGNAEEQRQDPDRDQ
ncbi:MAG: hypothetical protein PVH31_04410 [Ectothiorhodospiraceae bacterium]|jgi:hypothetical protein